MTMPAQPDGPQYTGRSIVVLAPDAHPDEESMARTVRSFTGTTSIASASDFGHGAMVMGEVGDTDATLFPHLGIAVVPGGGEDVAALQNAATTDERVRSVEPEQRVYAVTDQQLDYLRGYRDAADALLVRLDGRGGGAAPTALTAAVGDTDAATWGLQVTGVDTSPWTGEGIRLAILDSGIDLAHPDVAGRRVINQSFVPGEEVGDGHGHGTHTAGTAAGPRTPPSRARRYGVAGSATLYVGKVLDDSGSGADRQVLAGIDWAVAQRCQVISMSLGSNDRTVSAAYETAGRSALDAGCLVVASAGNDATRSLGDVGFVGRPANSPSIMAVGAVDDALAIADFSARTGEDAGGQVDVVGPGVAVFSAWPMPAQFSTISGTSMAAPHVSGIAALVSQATGATGMDLWGRVVQGARQLALPSVDVGAGLVQAPR